MPPSDTNEHPESADGSEKTKGDSRTTEAGSPEAPDSSGKTGDGSPETDDGILFELYAKYAGEPESRADVYGYWLFVLGSVVAFIGVVVYLLGPAAPPDPNYQVRGLAITLAAFGPPVVLFGILLLLPVRRRSVLVAGAGAVLALGAVAAFVYAYPYNWTVGTPDYSDQIIAVYMVGMAGIVSVAALIPIATGEKSFFFQEDYERGEEYPPVAVGEADRGGLFSVYRAEDNWHWRLIEQDALASAPRAHLSRLETEEAVESVKQLVSEAGLMEIRNAAFRLYEASEGKWRWLLMRADGSVVADGGEHFDARDAAAASVNDLKEYGPDAELLTIDDAAIDCHRREGGWQWRLVDEDRSPLLEGATGHGSREAAIRSAENIRDRVPDAGMLAIETYGVELFAEDDAWHWRILDADETVVATGTRSYDTRRGAENAAYDILEALPDAPTYDSGEPGYEVTRERDGAWAWRLVADERVVALGADTPMDGGTATDRAERMAAEAGAAEIVEIETAEFEYFKGPGGWRWRLVTADRETIAESATAFDSREDAAGGIEDVKTQAAVAELIEYDDAAFQVYETDGEWRWRLIDEDGNVLTDSGAEHDSKDSAMSSMMTVKENAPDAELLEIETAAFELFERDGAWNWRLVDEAGETTAQGGSWYDTRVDAREGMDRLANQAADSPARAMEHAMFQVYAEDDWQWRFVHTDGTVLAESAVDYGTRDEVEMAIEEDVRDVAADTPVHVVSDIAIQCVERGDSWDWQIIDTGRERVAKSDERYADRAAVVERVSALQEDAPTATVYEHKDTTFLLANSEDGWGWSLVGADRERLATAPGKFEGRDIAESAAERVRALFPEAAPIEYDDAAFEVLETDGEWRWRLVDEAETVVAAGVDGYGSREAAEDAVRAVRQEVAAASVIEIDAATFELHEDAGQWRWRLIDEDGTVLVESLAVYETRSEARESMQTMKEFAPDALTQVAE